MLSNVELTISIILSQVFLSLQPSRLGLIHGLLICTVWISLLLKFNQKLRLFSIDLSPHLECLLERLCPLGLGIIFCLGLYLYAHQRSQSSTQSGSWKDYSYHNWAIQPEIPWTFPPLPRHFSKVSPPISNDHPSSPFWSSSAKLARENAESSEHFWPFWKNNWLLSSSSFLVQIIAWQFFLWSCLQTTILIIN